MFFHKKRSFGKVKSQLCEEGNMVIDCGVLDLEIILAPILPAYTMLAHKEQILFFFSVVYVLIININKHVSFLIGLKLNYTILQIL